MRNEIAGRLRNDQRADAVGDGRDGSGPEHPLPRLEPEPERRFRRAGRAGDREVAEQGDEDADDDRQLLQRPQAAADFRRRDLGDVGRRDDAGGADADAAENAPEDEVADAEGAPEPMALTVNRIAAITMHRTRPIRSASGPAKKAPTADPSRASETERPIPTLVVLNSFFSASTAPLITAVSKPNRNPPSAAAAAMRTT